MSRSFTVTEYHINQHNVIPGNYFGGYWTAEEERLNADRVWQERDEKEKNPPPMLFAFEFENIILEKKLEQAHPDLLKPLLPVWLSALITPDTLEVSVFKKDEKEKQGGTVKRNGLYILGNILRCPLPKSTLSSASSWLTGCLWTPSRAAVQRKAIIRPWPAPQLWLQGWPKRTLYDHTSALDVTANINKEQKQRKETLILKVIWRIFIQLNQAEKTVRSAADSFFLLNLLQAAADCSGLACWDHTGGFPDLNNGSPH
ncbi:hypothetical protein Anapl_16882 [Anas platyrhynchos]|uniref:Uncharacterized protein n=1 Tax=Anas platyrhynchos TaxID=8839 RepID=R0JNW7_ANAPL|nr:hypothetical protein Anapl_16882 [Anas platyrhynchos]